MAMLQTPMTGITGGKGPSHEDYNRFLVLSLKRGSGRPWKSVRRARTGFPALHTSVSHETFPRHQSGHLNNTCLFLMVLQAGSPGGCRHLSWLPGRPLPGLEMAASPRVLTSVAFLLCSVS